MLPFAASVFLFFAIATGAIALFWPGQMGRSKSDQRIRGLRAAPNAEGGEEAMLPSLRRSRSAIPTLGRLLRDSPWADSVALQLQQANVQLRVGEYLLVRVFLGVLLFFVVVFIARFHPVGIVLGLVGAVAGYAMPPLYLKFLRRRRVSKIEKQLVEFAPMLASSLRSGFAIQQGMELAGRQMAPPLADELALVLNDMNLGASMEAALLDLGKRVGSPDLDMLITAILVQRTSGGNLAEILDQAGETLRERERIRGDLNTLTAQQRLTGFILSIYPVAIGLLLLAIMPSLWSQLFTDNDGRVFLGIALGLQVIGFLAMRRVMNIEV